MHFLALSHLMLHKPTGSFYPLHLTDVETQAQRG